MLAVIHATMLCKGRNYASGKGDQSATVNFEAKRDVVQNSGTGSNVESAGFAGFHLGEVGGVLRRERICGCGCDKVLNWIHNGICRIRVSSGSTRVERCRQSLPRPMRCASIMLFKIARRLLPPASLTYTRASQMAVWSG